MAVVSSFKASKSLLWVLFVVIITLSFFACTLIWRAGNFGHKQKKHLGHLDIAFLAADDADFYQTKDKRIISVPEAASKLIKMAQTPNPFFYSNGAGTKDDDKFDMPLLAEKFRYWRDLFHLFDDRETGLRRNFKGGSREIRSLSIFSLYEQMYRQYQDVERELFDWARCFYPSIREIYEGAYIPGSKGIVLSVSNRYVDLAVMLIKSIRTILESDIPIEVFYAGNGDLSPSSRLRLKASGSDITCRNILNLLGNNETGVEGWAIKPFALLLSSFEKVLFMDADVVLLQNPDIFFRPGSGFERTGTLFFHDRSLFQSRETVKWVRSLLSRYPQDIPVNRIMTRSSAHEQESGVLVLDKGYFPAFAGLLASCQLNLKEIRDKHTYRYFYGDKESFWLGFAMMGSQTSFSPFLPGLVASESNSRTFFKEKLRITPNLSSHISFDDDAMNGLLCSTQLLHVSPFNGRPFWFNNGIMVSKFQENSPPAVLTHWLLENDIIPEIQTLQQQQLEDKRYKHNRLSSKWFLFDGNAACIHNPKERAKPLNNRELQIIRDQSLLFLASKKVNL